MYKGKRASGKWIKRNSALKAQQSVPGIVAGDVPKLHHPSHPMLVLLPSWSDDLLFSLLMYNVENQHSVLNAKSSVVGDNFGFNIEDSDFLDKGKVPYFCATLSSKYKTSVLWEC